VPGPRPARQSKSCGTCEKSVDSTAPAHDEAVDTIWLMSHTQTGDRLQALVIEDDETIGQHLQSGLQNNGYDAYWARAGGTALTRARGWPPDVVLLDLGLPDIDGVEVARTLRAEQPDLLIVILTARSDEIDVVVGLDAGADDYLVKPFNLTVLLARLRAHLRRRPDAATDTEPIRVGDLVVDAAARRCLLRDREIDLRPKEFELLLALARNPGVAITREDLMAQVWDENWFGSTKTLDVTMATLRRRLSAAVPPPTKPSEPGPPKITTLRGHGYRLELPPSA
jgi:DNA-binding response OmpR family regulator